MNGWLWLSAGLLVGALNAASIAKTVGRLRPEEGHSSSKGLSLIASGFVLRLILSILVLMVALQHSATAGLLAFAGIWLGRWTALLWVSTPLNRRKVKA